MGNMTKYLRNLWAVFYLCMLGSFCLAQPSIEKKAGPGEVLYQIGDQTFLASYDFTCQVSKGIYNQSFSFGDDLIADFSGKGEDEQVQFRFANLVFAEPEHQENFTLEVGILSYSGMDLSQSPASNTLVSALREDGTKGMGLNFIPRPVPSAEIKFHLQIFNAQGEPLGASDPSFTMDFLRPEPSSEVEDQNKPVESSRPLSEDEVWNIVLAENSVDGFEKYLLMFPSGRYEDLARDKLLLVKEKNSWIYLSGLHTCKAYQNYLGYYPRGMYRKEAEAFLAELGCAGTAVKPSTEEIPALIDTDSEESSYRTAIRTGTISAYKDFVSQFPNGSFTQQMIRRIPFEILQQDFHHDSMFTVVFAYVVPPLTISQIEIEPDGLLYREQDKADGVPAAIKAGNSFFWPDGRFKAEVNPIRGSIYRFEATLITGKKYWVSFRDATGQVQTLELDSQVPSMEILRVEGLDATQDTLWIGMKGGISPYSVRFVKRGEPYSNYVHESKLKEKAGSFFLLKDELLKNMYVTGGIYDFFVLDSRKTQYKKYNLPILFSLDAGVNPHLWKILGPIILLLMGILIFLYRKSSLRDTR